VLPLETSAQIGASSTHSFVPSRDQSSSTAQQASGSTNGLGSQSQPQGSSLISTAQGSAGQSNVAPSHTPVDPLQAQQGQFHGVLPNGQFPPQLQQAFAQFQFVNQQLAAQLAAIGTNPGLQAMTPQQAQAQALLSPNFVPPIFQNILAQQQQQQQHARAAGGQTAIGSVPQPDIQANHPRAQNIQQGAAQGSVLDRPSTPGNTNTIIQENHRPNGERWQMVIQSGQVNINPNHNLYNHAGPRAPFSGSPSRASPSPQSIHTAQTTMPSISFMHLQSHLSAMEAAMAGGNPLPEAVFEQARQMLNGIPDLAQEVHSSLDTRLNNAAHRARHLRETLNSHLARAAQERVTTQRTTHGVESSAVYVLSSPNGPQALLISPTGLYSTPWHLPTIGSIPQAFVHHHSPGAPALGQTINSNNPTNGQGPNVDAAQVVPAQQPAAHQINAAAQGQQQQQVNQARDLVRIILPLGGHLWLLVRLFGFVYFFTAGAGWRRTILLGVVACLVFVAQTGIFRPIVQAIWDPVRRHAEGLVPLAGNERPRVAAAGAGDNANAPDAQPANREPIPQEAAQRLLQEREGRDVSFLRQSIRQVERAIALFVASLVPGVGERHIAAREAAETARQAEIREREDQTRREEEERQRGNGEGTGSAAQEAAQPPLIEV